MVETSAGLLQFTTLQQITPILVYFVRFLREERTLTRAIDMGTSLYKAH